MNNGLLASPAASTLPAQRSLWDIFGVYVSPFICFAVDVAIGGPVLATYPGAVWTLALTGIGAFAWSTYLQADSRAAAFVAGMLVLTGSCAILIATILLPLSLIALVFFGFGLLGLIPFLTGWRLLKRSRSFLSGPAGSRHLQIGVGALVALLPAVVAFAGERLGDEIRRADLTSNDAQRILRVLQGTHLYGVRDIFVGTPLIQGISLRSEVCRVRNRIPVGDPQIEVALRELLGNDNDKESIEDICVGLDFD